MIRSSESRTIYECDPKTVDEESRLAEIAALKKHIINYSRTREAYIAYRKAGYSKKFLEEHREEIALHKAAKAAFDQFGAETATATASRGSRKGGARKKIPTIKQLNQEYAQVLADKKKAYAEYRTARKTMPNKETISVSKRYQRRNILVKKRMVHYGNSRDVGRDQKKSTKGCEASG